MKGARKRQTKEKVKELSMEGKKNRLNFHGGGRRLCNLEDIHNLLYMNPRSRPFMSSY